MDFNRDVTDELRLEHESEDQWKMRKKFLQQNALFIKDIGINRLVSLSMTWFNIVFLGCRYPPELMEKVKAMSEGITVDMSNHTKPPLESSFHAEGELPNGTKRKLEEQDSLDGTSSKKKKKKRKKQSNNLDAFQQTTNSSDLLMPTEPSESCLPAKNHFYDDTKDFGSTKWPPPLMGLTIPRLAPVMQEEGIVKNFEQSYKLLGQFVIIRHELATSPISILADSAALNKKNISFNFECESATNHRCSIFIGNVFVGGGEGTTKKQAKAVAAENVFNLMKKVFPVVMKSCPVESMLNSADEIKVSDICKGGAAALADTNQENRLRESEEFEEIPESNVGHKLLQKLGWSGGGLGKAGQGRQAPIPVEQRPKRAGLGIDLTQYEDQQGRLLTVKMDRKLIHKLLSEVADGTRDYLVFSSLLSKEQRSFVHSASVKYGLKSQSYGKGSDRFLTIQRKMSKRDLLQSAKKGSAFLTLEGTQSF